MNQDLIDKGVDDSALKEQEVLINRGLKINKKDFII